MLRKLDSLLVCRERWKAILAINLFHAFRSLYDLLGTVILLCVCLQDVIAIRMWHNVDVVRNYFVQRPQLCYVRGSRFINISLLLKKNKQTWQTECTIYGCLRKIELKPFIAMMSVSSKRQVKKSKNFRSWRILLFFFALHAKGLASKHTEPLSNSLSVWMSVWVYLFCLLRMYNMCMYICIRMLSTVGTGVLICSIIVLCLLYWEKDLKKVI